MNTVNQSDLHVVHLGISGFPYGFGAMQRLILLHKGLVHAGVHTLVINRKGRYEKGKYPDIPLKGNYEGVEYVYLTDSPYKPDSFLKRNLQKLKGFYREFRLLRKMKRQGKLDAAVLYILGEIGYLLYYRMLSRIIGFPLILNYVEYRTAFNHRKWTTRLNDRWFDTYASRWVDGVLPISEYLIEHLKQAAPNTPYLKVPVVTDFDKFNPDEQEDMHPHMVYCGAASYRELVDFVLEAFEQMQTPGVHLHFILGGSKDALKAVEERIQASPKKDSIQLFGNVPHAQVPGHLINGHGLLIPMRPTIQDAARFPHKAGEYVASGSPLITTAFGEIQYYLEDGVSAFIADEYEVDAYTVAMDHLFANLEVAKVVGNNGREAGFRAFDYRVHGEALRDFIAQIAGKKLPQKTSIPNSTL